MMNLFIYLLISFLLEEDSNSYFIFINFRGWKFWIPNFNTWTQPSTFIKIIGCSWLFFFLSGRILACDNFLDLKLFYFSLVFLSYLLLVLSLILFLLRIYFFFKR